MACSWKQPSAIRAPIATIIFYFRGLTPTNYFDGASLKLTNAADWGGIGTTNYVTLQAVVGTGTNELVVAAGVVSVTTRGTVFRFR